MRGLHQSESVGHALGLVFGSLGFRGVVGFSWVISRKGLPKAHKDSGYQCNFWHKGLRFGA